MFQTRVYCSVDGHGQGKGQQDKSNSSSGIHITSHLQDTEHHRPLKAEANPTLGSNAEEGEICTPHSAMGSAAGGN